MKWSSHAYNIIQNPTYVSKISGRKKSLNWTVKDEQKMTRKKRQQNQKHRNINPYSICVHKHEFILEVTGFNTSYVSN